MNKYLISYDYCILYIFYKVTKNMKITVWAVTFEPDIVEISDLLDHKCPLNQLTQRIYYVMYVYINAYKIVDLIFHH